MLGVIEGPAWVRHEAPLTHGVKLRPLEIGRVLVLHVARVRLLCLWIEVVLETQQQIVGPFFSRAIAAHVPGLSVCIKPPLNPWDCSMPCNLCDTASPSAMLLCALYGVLKAFSRALP